MKKTISFLLFLAMILSMASCNFDFSDAESDTGADTSTNTQTGTDTSTSTQTGTDTSTSTQTGTDTSTSTQTSTDTNTDTNTGPSEDIKIDKTDYATLVNPDNPSVLLYGGTQIEVPSFTPYYHNYKAALSLTFDDGYDTASARYISNTLAGYGFKGTAMISPGFIFENETRINEWNDILAIGGLDVGAHGFDHLHPSSQLSEETFEKETKTARDYLRSVFPGQNVLTFASPYAQITPEYRVYVEKYFIANREAGSGVTPKLSDDFDKYNIGSASVTKDMSAAVVNSMVSSAVSSGRWMVELIHCVLDTPSNSTDMSKAVFEEHLRYINLTYKNTLWVASFEEVCIYKLQLENAKINYTSANKESITFNITCDLDSNIYNIPMTVKINIPQYCDTAYAIVNGKEQDTLISNELGKKYIYVLDCPVNNGDIKIVLGGNSNFDNGCEHHYVSTNTVQPSCTQRGYITRTCSSCQNSYNYRYTIMPDHTFGEWGISESGETKIRTCTVCDLQETEIIEYSNVLTDSAVNASEPKNQWVPSSNMIDGSPNTMYMSNEGSGTYAEFTLTQKKYIKNIKIILNNYNIIDWIQSEDKNQTVVLSIYKNGEWKTVGTWQNDSISSDDEKITVDFDVKENDIEKIKLEFTTAAFGATSIYEIYAYGN